jgi:hypothetical protein
MALTSCTRACALRRIINVLPALETAGLRSKLFGIEPKLITPLLSSNQVAICRSSVLKCRTLQSINRLHN